MKNQELAEKLGVCERTVRRRRAASDPEVLELLRADYAACHAPRLAKLANDLNVAAAEIVECDKELGPELAKMGRRLAGWTLTQLGESPETDT